MKIISGGQTGADRAALDVAIEKGLVHGGFIPKGRQAEDGALPAKYDSMNELNSYESIKRTEKNVIHSDATLIFTRGKLTGGTLATVEFTLKHTKPHLVIDLETLKLGKACQRIMQWLHKVQPSVLNIAGPRESDAPGIYRQVFGVLTDCIK